MARESGGTASLLQPEVGGSRLPSWNRVVWSRGTHNKKTMASLGWPSTELLVVETKFGSEEAPEIMATRLQEKREREWVPRVTSPSKLREPVDEMLKPVTQRQPRLDMKPCSHPVVLPRHPAIGSRTSLRDQCFFFCLCTHCCRSERSVHLLPFYASLGFGTTAVSGDS